MLEGQVEVRHHLAGGRHRVDQAGPQLGRLQVGDADPVEAVDRGQLGQQRLEQPQVAEVLAVRGGVLADQDHLAHPLLGQPARLGQDVGRAAGEERAAEGGDRAEGAAPVAARGQLQRGGRAVVQPAARGARAGGRGQAGGQVGDHGRRRRRGAVRVSGHRTGPAGAAPPASTAAAGGGPRGRAPRRARRRGSCAAGRRCPGTSRSRAPRRPRAARRPTACRSARPGSRPRRRPSWCRGP